MGYSVPKPPHFCLLLSLAASNLSHLGMYLKVWTEQVADLGWVPGPEVFWMSRFDQWLPLHIYLLSLRGEGKTVLLNCGPPLDYLDRMNAVWREELGERSRMTVAPDQHIEAVLARHGITPDAGRHGHCHAAASLCAR